jgi:dTDP-4-dehydrorhamnose reductase
MLGAAVHFRLAALGWAVEPVERSRFDVLCSEPTDLPLGGQDLVINCTGLINRRLQTEPSEHFWRVNALFPRRLADACENAGTRLVHITTDCVFDGASGLYDEGARPTATDLYGRTKAAGEPLNAMVLRTSIIGPEWSRFYSLLCWFLSVDKACGFTNHLWNGITTLELARVLHCIQERSLYRRGTFHIHGEDVNKYNLLQLIREAFERTTPIAPTEARTTKDMRLRTRHSDLLIALGIRPLREQLSEVASVADRRGIWKADPVV